MVQGKTLIRKAGWIADSLLWAAAGRFMVRLQENYPDERLAIGIATYKDRYDDCLKPLVRKISKLFPGMQVIVAANGHVNSEEQVEYLSVLEKFCTRFPNVRLIAFTEPKGLSHLWNTIIRESDDSAALILNDDINVKTGFRKFIYRSGILDSAVATINSSWSHFLISKNVTEKIGLFDEGLSEFGGEDDDYLARLAIAGVIPVDFSTGTLARRKISSKGRSAVNSYGKDPAMQRGGYSTANTEYLESKWEIRPDQFEGAVRVSRGNNQYWKLRSGNLAAAGSDSRSDSAPGAGSAHAPGSAPHSSTTHPE